MLPSSLVVIVATAALTLLGALVMLWAWWRGFFRDLDAQARVIFEPHERRFARPWETPAQRREREAEHGPPLAAPPGEWGGAA